MKKLLSLFVIVLCTTMVVNAADVTVTKTVDELVAENNFTISAGNNATCYTTLKLDENVTVSTSGEPNCGSIWGAENAQWRLYQAKGGDLTIAVGGGCELKSIKLTYAVYNNGVLIDGPESDALVNVSGQSVTYVVGNSGSKTNGQVRITAFEVVYAAGDPTAPSITAPSAVDFGEVLIGSTLEEKTISVVAKNYTETLTATLSEGAAYTVTGELTNEGGDLTIACTATEEGTHEATLTLSAGGEEVHSIALKARIVTPITVEEFLAAKDSVNYSYLVGTIKNIAKDKNDETKVNAYGNFDLEDETGTIYVYGLLTADGEAKKFESLGLKEGDILTLKGKYTEYKGTPQVGSGQYVSHTTNSAVENVVADKAKAVKVIENGQLFILKNGVKYNIFGAQVD